MRGADVVEEEERLGALDEDVVDAVVDEVLADGRVLLREAGDLELRADAVRAPDKEHVLAGGGEEPAEVADSPYGPARGSRRGHFLDRLDADHLRVDVDAGGGVSRFLFGLGLRLLLCEHLDAWLSLDDGLRR